MAETLNTGSFFERLRVGNNPPSLLMASESVLGRDSPLVPVKGCGWLAFEVLCTFRSFTFMFAKFLFL